MATASSATGNNPFAAIIIPPAPLPQDTPLIKPIDEPTASDFLQKVVDCFNAIIVISTPQREGKLQRNLKLKELHLAIQKTLKVCPDESEVARSLVEWGNTITALRVRTKRAYQTHAHHFIATEKGFHLMKAAPSLEVEPRIRIDLNNIQGTFTRLKQASPSDKIQGLQNFKDEILEAIATAEAKLSSDKSQAAKIDELNDALVQIADYVDSLEGVEERSALKQYRWRTKDAAQVEKIASFLDPDGIKDVSNFFLFRPDLPPAELSIGLLAILNERYYSHPSRSPIDYVKLWPTSYKDIDEMKEVGIPARKGRIKELFKLVENTAMEDPLLLVIYDYLFNFYDPTGDLRREHIEENIKKNDTKCQILGRVGASMVRLGLNLDGFLRHSSATNPFLPTTDAQKPIKTVLTKIKTESLENSEIVLLSNILRAEAATLFLGFNMDVYHGDLSVFDKLHHPLDVFHRQLRGYFQQMVESLPDEKRKYLLRNLTLLAKNLVETGEFNISLHLFLLIKQFHTEETKEKCAKEFTSLTNLFQYAGNMGNLREYLKKRAQAGMLSIPLLTFVNGDCVFLQDNLKKIKAERQKQLDEALGSRAKDLSAKLQAKKASKETTTEWVLLLDAVRALGLPKGDYEAIRASLRTALRNETLQELKVEKHLTHLYAAWIAIKIYYKSYKRAPETQSIMDIIWLSNPYTS